MAVPKKLALPPGPRPRRPRGMLLELLNDPLGLLLDSSKYGDVIGIPVLGRTLNAAPVAKIAAIFSRCFCNHRTRRATARG